MSSRLQNNYSIEQKKEIARRIKNITLDAAIKDFKKLQDSKFTTTIKAGNKVVDYFTFESRLNTIAIKGNITFYDFLYNCDEFINSAGYIKRMIEYYEQSKFASMTLESKYYDVFRLYFTSINAFPTIFAAAILDNYKPAAIIDPCAGWGNRLVAAMSRGINYTGFDTNTDNDYKNIIETLLPYAPAGGSYSVEHRDACGVDYSQYKYDCIFTSPPYYNIEIYNGTVKQSRADWNKWYSDLFKKVFESLTIGGIMILSINQDMYNGVFKILFGEADGEILMTRSRRGKYEEYIYLWRRRGAAGRTAADETTGAMKFAKTTLGMCGVGKKNTNHGTA